MQTTGISSTIHQTMKVTGGRRVNATRPFISEIANMPGSRKKQGNLFKTVVEAHDGLEVNVARPLKTRGHSPKVKGHQMMTRHASALQEEASGST